MTLRVGSAFAGIGGIDLGLESVGPFETIFHSEVSPPALRVMSARFPQSESLGSIVTVTEGLLSPPTCDVLVGGPPCQDISHANAFARTGLAGSRSGLFYAYATLVEQTKPQWVLMEQVVGLMTSNKGADLRSVRHTFERLGYATAAVIVNSRAYVPQTRERIILVANRHGDAAARALLPLREDGACDLGAGKPQRRRLATAPAGSPRVYRKSRRAASAADAESWVVGEYANTLTLSDVGTARATVIVLDEAGRPRVMTPVEWERAHGFPDDWTKPAGTDAHRWRVLGNAVSPPVAARAGVGILDVESAA